MLSLQAMVGTPPSPILFTGGMAWQRQEQSGRGQGRDKAKVKPLRKIGDKM